MGNRTLAQIEAEIEETKNALNDVHGTETEVYARIVGYYRAVKHWNNGKRDEFNLRKMFTLEDSKCKTKDNFSVTSQENNHKKSKASETGNIKSNTIESSSHSEKVHSENLHSENAHSENVSYEIYTRKTCPNCPPVKAFVETLEIPGRAIDVDTKEGLAEAAKKGIFASPTVIFYNDEGKETARCHNVEELEEVFSKIKITA